MSLAQQLRKLAVISASMILISLSGTISSCVFADDRQADESAVKAEARTNEHGHSICAIPCISWIDPAVKPQIALLCIHGLGLYSGAYQAFGTRIAKLGIATYAIDVRGFGSWMKAKGHTEVDFKACLYDVKRALTAIRRTHPGAPVFIMGESMGGAIALRAAAMYPELVEGVISSVPASERFQQKKTDLKVALEYLKGRNKPFDIGTSIVQQATQNEQLRQDWSSDPLDRMNLSANELIQFQSFMNENHEAAKEITDDPVLFVQGTKDKLVKPDGTWELFNKLGTPDKYFYAVPSEHLIFEEGQSKAADLDRLTVLASNWMHMVAAKNGTIVHSITNNSLPEQTTENPLDPRIIDALNKLARGDHEQALPLMTAAVKANPDSAIGHYWLAVTYAKSQKKKEARLQMHAALAAMRASAARDPQRAIPGVDDVQSAAQNTLSDADKPYSDLTAGKPTVIAFFTPWCEQCEGIDGFYKHAEHMLGDSVTFVKVDLDDPDNSALAKRLKVDLIPTYVYLDKNGRVSSTLIGKTGFANFAKGILAIVR